MFNTETYTQRRKELIARIDNGLILLTANDESPMNYSANSYRYRQDSTFLYYFGLEDPGIAAVLDSDSGEQYIFGDELGIDDIIWMGSQNTLSEKSIRTGVKNTQPYNNLEQMLKEAIKQGRKIHFLPPYRSEHIFKLAALTGYNHQDISAKASTGLIKAIVSQRSVKSAGEIKEIRRAHDITREMHITAMKMARAGLYERDIAGKIEGIALSKGAGVSFPVILSVHPEILHNHYHGNQMKDGDLLVNDSGAESTMFYAADITRTFPVNGKFTSRQREIYEIVLQSHTEAITAIKPGVRYRDIHLHSAKIIAAGLKNLGLMKGDVQEAVQAGAHALFYPHGLGHMIGLDVHDMENYGEDFVGYDDEVKRSDQFGLAYLRLGRALQSGFVLTVEPGIYFIPALIEKWKEEKKHLNYINYEKVEEYIDFGGIRIEDDVLVTDSGSEVIGELIPKTPAEIEEACSG